MAKTPEISRTVHLQITCVTPPSYPANITEIELGLQDRQLALQPGQLQPDGSLLYEIDAVVTPRQGTPEARWGGPYVHGTLAVPFLYVSVKPRSTQPVGWLKRLKIPLPALVWDLIEAMQTVPCFAVSIAGSGSGTVPLLGEGWTLQQQANPVLRIH